MNWVGIPTGALDLIWPGGDIAYLSRNVGGDFWLIYVFQRRSSTEPWSVVQQYLSCSGSYCAGGAPLTEVSPLSQIEYGYIADGEDVGGYIHRNETQTGETWLIDGQPVALTPGNCYSGSAISLTQEIDASIAAGLLSRTTLTHAFTPTEMVIDHTHNWLRAATLGWYYSNMWAVSNQVGGETEFTQMELGGDRFDFADYLGLNNIAESRPGQTVASARGVACGGDIGIHGKIIVDPIGLNDFNSADPDTWWQINRSAGDEWSKFYAQRSSAANPETVAAGDNWAASARYLFAVALPAQTEFKC